ncbi:Putative uncharacterised protein [Haemophilus influenzae F3047]|uniref:Uncharacterized protein n=1 Tax=Haemophilus influenzae F3047 TaxID=935897 RepID=A0AAV2U4Q1_HAEIF|nr:Putative uncharacterised protein [Haemophilus influenzae F3047]
MAKLHTGSHYHNHRRNKLWLNIYIVTHWKVTILQTMMMEIHGKMKVCVLIMSLYLSRKKTLMPGICLKNRNAKLCMYGEMVILRTDCVF